MHLMLLPVGTHWGAGTCLAVAVKFGPTERLAHPRDTLEGVLLWLAGCPLPLRSPL